MFHFFMFMLFECTAADCECDKSFSSSEFFFLSLSPPQYLFYPTLDLTSHANFYSEKEEERIQAESFCL